jgi:hypothetical protein
MSGGHTGRVVDSTAGLTPAARFAIARVRDEQQGGLSILKVAFDGEGASGSIPEAALPLDLVRRLNLKDGDEVRVTALNTESKPQPRVAALAYA